MWSFLGELSGNVPLFCAIWYDSGYSLRQLRSLWQQRQVRTVHPFPDEEVAGVAWFDAPRAVLAFLAVFVFDADWKPCTSPWRSHKCSSWTCLTCPLCSETGTFSAVCVQTVEIPQVPFLVMLLTCPLLCMSRSSTSPSWRRGLFPWSSEQIMRFPWCSPLIRWSMSWLCRSWGAVRSRPPQLRQGGG